MWPFKSKREKELEQVLRLAERVLESTAQLLLHNPSNTVEIGEGLASNAKKLRLYLKIEEPEHDAQ